MVSISQKPISSKLMTERNKIKESRCEKCEVFATGATYVCPSIRQFNYTHMACPLPFKTPQRQTHNSFFFLDKIKKPFNSFFLQKSKIIIIIIIGGIWVWWQEHKCSNLAHPHLHLATHCCVDVDGFNSQKLKIIIIILIPQRKVLPSTALCCAYSVNLLLQLDLLHHYKNPTKKIKPFLQLASDYSRTYKIQFLVSQPIYGAQVHHGHSLSSSSSPTFFFTF